MPYRVELRSSGLVDVVEFLLVDETVMDAVSASGLTIGEYVGQAVAVGPDLERVLLVGEDLLPENVVWRIPKAAVDVLGRALVDAGLVTIPVREDPRLFELRSQNT